MTRRRIWRTVGWLALLSGLTLYGQGVNLSARIKLLNAESKSQSSNVLVWLTPVGSTAPLSAPAPSIVPPRLIQHNKSFVPHLLVVPVGALVEFPNRDPFFHNVFSLFEGKRFDLGLYEAGSTRNVRFDKPGISYIFCNIHAEMSAVVVALVSPYYGISNSRGEVLIPNVPAGRYTMRVWQETALPEALDAMTQQITVSEGHASLGVLNIPAIMKPPAHKNKYGGDYNPPEPDSPAYER